MLIHSLILLLYLHVSSFYLIVKLILALGMQLLSMTFHQSQQFFELQ